jgi:hypothetical protein
VLDFLELPQDGIAFEQLVRETCLALGYRARWSGKGADAGRDLLVEEAGDALFGRKTRTWLVSCKHMAHANGGKGRAVSAEDVGNDGGIVDAVAQHEAHGYLLVCSTAPSSALVTRLEAIERSRGLPTHVWDGVELERMLTSPRGWAVAQRFMPASTDATGWKVFATADPNRFVGVTRGFYIKLTNRHGSTLPYQLRSVDDRLDRAGAIPLPKGHELRPRAMWCDDKHGGFVWYFDYIYDAGHAARRQSQPPPDFPYSVDDIKNILGDGTVTYDDGQWDSFEITMRPVDKGHDAYDPDHYSFYDDMPGYV